VSLQQARQALESYTADARRAEEAEDQRHHAKRSPPHGARGKESA
jgi:hypothetical protein